MILAVVAAYAVVVGLYASGGDVAVSESPAAFGGAVVVVATPEKMDAAARRLTVSLLPLQSESGEYTDGVTVRKDFNLFVSAADGSTAIPFTTSTLVSRTEVPLWMDGAFEQWPFDHYRSTSFIVAGVRDAEGQMTLLPTEVRLGGGGLSGWTIDKTETVVGDGLVTVELTASRSGATVAFGVVLLTLMVIIPALVLVVAIAVLRGRRRVEIGALGWMGAMVFATIPLRNFLPGSPPIGSWVDYLVVLWVLAALVAGLIIFVVAWWRHGPR